MSGPRICLHGAESSGKTTIAPKLAAAIGARVLDEYGREYAETVGIDFTMADLVAIGREHDRRAAALRAEWDGPVILDTDPLMTAVWAQMLFGMRDPWFDAWDDVADLYLLFDMDLPWVDDGTRLFGTVEARARFFALAKAELERRGVRWALVRGHGEARLESALAAIASTGLGLGAK